jgi:hypothetical protein
MKQVAIMLFLLPAVLLDCTGQHLNNGYIRHRKVRSYQQIFALRHGCLLVMLHRNQNKIDALHDLGKHSEAEMIKNQQASKNKAIIKAFRDNYDFSEARFFLNSDALKMIQYGPDSVTFLTDSLVPDTSIHVKSKKYFIGEFGMLQEDTAKYFSGYNIVSTDSGLQRLPAYYSSPGPYYPAFTMQSDKLVQLKKPFPNFIIITETDAKIFFLDAIVIKLNARLKAFYDDAEVKIKKGRFVRYFRNGAGGG